LDKFYGACSVSTLKFCVWVCLQTKTCPFVFFFFFFWFSSRRSGCCYKKAKRAATRVKKTTMEDAPDWLSTADVEVMTGELVPGTPPLVFWGLVFWGLVFWGLELEFQWWPAGSGRNIQRWPPGPGGHRQRSGQSSPSPASFFYLQIRQTLPPPNLLPRARESPHWPLLPGSGQREPE